MSVEPASSSDRAATVGPEESGLLQMHFLNWPLRDQPKRSLGLVLAMTLASILAGMLSDSFSMGLLAWMALAIASWQYWLPITYEIGPYGIRQIVLSRVRRISWQQIRRVEFRSHGIRFFPDHDPAQLASLRGLYVYCPGEEEAINQVVSYYVNSIQPSRSSSRPTAH